MGRLIKIGGGVCVCRGRKAQGADRQTYKQTHRHRDRDRQTDTQSCMQTDRQTDTHPTLTSELRRSRTQGQIQERSETPWERFSYGDREKTPFLEAEDGERPRAGDKCNRSNDPRFRETTRAQMDSNVASGQRRTLIGVHPPAPWSLLPTFSIFLVFPGSGTESARHHGDLGLSWLGGHFTPKHYLGNIIDLRHRADETLL